MGIQTTMFEKPNEDPTKISSLIRSEISHELGLTLAKANNYNHVELLIDLLTYDLTEFDTSSFGINCYEYVLIEGEINGNAYSLLEREGEEFYLTLRHGQDLKVELKIHEWCEDQWGDFDLAKLAEKEIRKNRQYIDAVLKNKA